jgi:hypothetical protein
VKIFTTLDHGNREHVALPKFQRTHTRNRDQVPGPLEYLFGFLLDFAVNQTDNYTVETMRRLIYSPLDTPKGLRRGYLFSGPPQGAHHAS